MYSLLQLLRHRPTLHLASLCGLACHVLPAAAVAPPPDSALGQPLWTSLSCTPCCSCCPAWHRRHRAGPFSVDLPLGNSGLLWAAAVWSLTLHTLARCAVAAGGGLGAEPGGHAAAAWRVADGAWTPPGGHQQMRTDAIGGSGRGRRLHGSAC